MFRVLLIICLVTLVSHNAKTQENSVAFQWTEVLVDAIRNDFARPTVHARNLFHISSAMYDAWAVIDGAADPYFLGKQRGDYIIDFDGFVNGNINIKEAQQEAISYAAYRLILHRFRFAPESEIIFENATSLFEELGYDPEMLNSDYSTGSPAALGNYIAEQVIQYGFTDGANETNFYQNTFYTPSNEAFSPEGFGNPTLVDFNRWQPLGLLRFVDQAGFELLAGINEFLSAEWGGVVPFALSRDDLTEYNRDGNNYNVYHDPGPPPYYEEDYDNPLNNYRWGFTMVPIWGAHLDPADSIRIDISPASIGNNPPLPESFDEYEEFYDFYEGGDASRGHEVNPKTGNPYEENIVLRGDYGRVLAEFWADGIDSETPPGHWFTILNKVMQHPEFLRRFEGQGDELDPLEYDVKAYFMLGGAMHDAAIAAWSIKGWYDYVRPISSIRAMAELGQCSDSTKVNYHKGGLPLIEGYIELITPEDHNPPYIDTARIIRRGLDRFGLIDEVKIKSWVGPDYVLDPDADVGGVEWIPAMDWWPYQRPTFVTPPFAGYISGHSTFSRAAAEVLTMLTGDPYFPGGMGEFFAPKDEYLVFEKGPSEDITLQWATYRDASDQTSLSRIWGGIHPPADDIPGRIIGEQVGIDAFLRARTFFKTSSTEAVQIDKLDDINVFPNPVRQGQTIMLEYEDSYLGAHVQMRDLNGKLVLKGYMNGLNLFTIDTERLSEGAYVLTVFSDTIHATSRIIVSSK